MKSAIKERASRRLHIELPPLPYGYDALAPVISKETLELHHDKHHRKYVETTNQLLGEESLDAHTLEEVVRSSTGKLFNNAAQAWNHDFYWHSLAPKGGKPSAAFMKKLQSDLGGWDKFATAYAEAANGQFGSGWAWLVVKNGKLAIVATPNAETPMARGTRCLLALDVWEHAYYVDYRNEREDYVEAVINERLNWEFAERNLGAVK
jgi:Fe-Mn family superoxide dismutase